MTEPTAPNAERVEKLKEWARKEIYTCDENGNGAGADRYNDILIILSDYAAPLKETKAGATESVEGYPESVKRALKVGGPYIPHPVKMRRFMNGLSQDALAQKAGVCRSEISRLESGYHVSSRVLCMVADALGSSPEALSKDPQK